MNPCVTCRFYKKPGWLSARGAICTNPACDEMPWTFHDQVTGEDRHYERRHRTCELARMVECAGGRLWSPLSDANPVMQELPPVIFDPSKWTGRP